MTLQTTAPLVHQSLDATNRSASELARLVIDGTMTLDAPYQRGSVWTTEQRQNLVRSWLLGIPVPAIILNARYTRPEWGNSEHYYACIDGKQRLQAAVAWFAGELAVPASWFRDEQVADTIDTPDGPYVTYGHLTTPGQRYTNNRFLLPTAEAKVGTLAEEASIFGLVNGGGVLMDAETMAHAEAIANGQEV